jgi:hypothetical protein
MENTENFYVQKRNYWLKFLRNFMNNKKVEVSVLQKYFEPEKIPELRMKIEQEFLELLPQVPDFGHKKIDRYSIDMIKNTQSLAFYRVLKAEGIPLRTIGQIMFEIADVYYKNVSPITKFFMRIRVLSPAYQRKYKRQIEERKGSVDPEDYHVEYVEGDGENLIFGLNYTNCAATHFLKKQGAAELHPYLCLCDYPMMRGFNVGFNREQNIAIGGSMCTFRIYRDYPTPRGWPPEEVPEYQNFQFGQ